MALGLVEPIQGTLPYLELSVASSLAIETALRRKVWNMHHVWCVTKVLLVPHRLPHRKIGVWIPEMMWKQVREVINKWLLPLLGRLSGWEWVRQDMQHKEKTTIPRNGIMRGRCKAACSSSPSMHMPREQFQWPARQMPNLSSGLCSLKQVD